MKNKGFTLVEILAVIVIIAIIGAIGMISVNTFMGTGEERYYEALKSDILLAGNDYFQDHRDELPRTNDVNEIPLSDLVSQKYMEPVKDDDGNECTNGKVVVYREDNQYKYVACLYCKDSIINDPR